MNRSMMKHAAAGIFAVFMCAAVLVGCGKEDSETKKID